MSEAESTTAPGFLRVATNPHLFFRRGLGTLMDPSEMQCQECGRSVTFLNPTEERQRWFIESHRCIGDAPHKWQGGYR